MAAHSALKVVAWFGDAAHDFPDDLALKWGTQKFMLPILCMGIGTRNKKEG